MWFALAGCAWLDGDPPTLEVRAPEAAVREVVIAVSAADPRPGLGALALSVDGGPEQPITPGEVPLALAEGAHTVRVVAIDRALRRNVAVREVTVTVDRTAPGLAIESTPAAQGRTFAVWVRADEPLAEGRVRIGEREVPLYPVGDAWRALVGVAIRAAPGETPVEVVARDAAGNEARVTHPVTVAETAFEEGGFIRLTKRQIAARQDEEGKAKMRAERDAAYAHPLPEQRWRGPFRLPTEGRPSSPFGKYRRYSTGDRSHHTGLDLAARTGTPVIAAAAGRVLVAGEQVIFGNVVIVHHGHGVSTSYNHLDTIAVEVGDEVEAGELLGTVGSTGQSTGPHLHWGLVVGGEAVDPGQWLDESFEAPPAAR